MAASSCLIVGLGFSTASAVTDVEARLVEATSSREIELGLCPAVTQEIGVTRWHAPGRFPAACCGLDGLDYILPHDHSTQTTRCQMIL